jgi:hypothetical protein
MTRHTTTVKDVTELCLTIYQNQFATVKEKRALHLQEPVEEIHYMDVAATIETDSILVSGVGIESLNYEYDLVGKEKLLEKYLDRTVYLHDKETKQQQSYRLLSVAGSIILEHTETKEIVIDPEGELKLPKLPDGLMVKPALIWKVQPAPIEELAVSYLAKGFHWNCNYVVSLEENTLNLVGWVDIRNESGTTFPDAKIKLIAGEVQRQQRRPRVYEKDINEMIVYSNEPMPSFVEQSFNDYHMYTLQRPATLKNNQSKQIQLFERSNIPYRKYYRFRRGDSSPDIMLSFDNDKASGGIPLPKGIVKVYGTDPTDGQREFIGEDYISHTPQNVPLLLKLGEAFDITMLDSGRIEKKRDRKGFIYETYKYVITNQKQESADIELSHYVSESLWTLEEASEACERQFSSTLLFTLTLEPEETRELTFTIKIDDRKIVKVEEDDVND